MLETTDTASEDGKRKPIPELAPDLHIEALV